MREIGKNRLKVGFCATFCAYFKMQNGIKDSSNIGYGYVLNVVQFIFERVREQFNFVDFLFINSNFVRILHVW